MNNCKISAKKISYAQSVSKKILNSRQSLKEKLSNDQKNRRTNQFNASRGLITEEHAMKTRKQKMAQYKMEKQRKKEEENKKKLPPFKAGIVRHKMNSPYNFTRFKIEKKTIEKPPKIFKFSTVGNVRAHHSPKITVPMTPRFSRIGHRYCDEVENQRIIHKGLFQLNHVKKTQELYSKVNSNNFGTFNNNQPLNVILNKNNTNNLKSKQSKAIIVENEGLNAPQRNQRQTRTLTMAKKNSRERKVQTPIEENGSKTNGNSLFQINQALFSIGHNDVSGVDTKAISQQTMKSLQLRNSRTGRKSIVPKVKTPTDENVSKNNTVFPFQFNQDLFTIGHNNIANAANNLSQSEDQRITRKSATDKMSIQTKVETLSKEDEGSLKKKKSPTPLKERHFNKSILKPSKHERNFDSNIKVDITPQKTNSEGNLNTPLNEINIVTPKSAYWLRSRTNTPLSRNQVEIPELYDGSRRSLRVKKSMTVTFAGLSLDSPRTVSVTFQRRRLNQEKTKLLKLCTQWNNVLEENCLRENIIPAEFKDEIDSVIGQTKLLTSDKFEQMAKLIDQFEYQKGKENLSEPVLLENDIDSFWDMINLQVSKMYEKFERLEMVKRNNWTNVEVEKSVKRKVRVRQKEENDGQKMTKHTQVKSKIGDFLRNKRNQARTVEAETIVFV